MGKVVKRIHISIKNCLVVAALTLILWGTVKLHTYTPVLLERNVEILYEDDILCGRYLHNDLGSVSGEYEMEFSVTEILPEIVMQEGIYAELSYTDQNPNWINNQLNMYLPEDAGHPTHKIIIGVLQGSVAHVTERYLWFDYFQQTKEFYQVYDFHVTGYELYAVFTGTTCYVANISMTQMLEYSNKHELIAAVESPKVAELIQ